MSLKSFFVIIAAAALTGYGGWGATVSAADRVVQAPGKVVSDKRMIAIKPIDTSLVEKVHVNIGDIVRKGDVLISFDQTVNRKEVRRLEREICFLETRIARFFCEFEGREYAPAASPRFAKITPEEYARITRAEKAIFEQRKNDHDNRITYYNSALNQMDASKKTKEDIIRNQRERLKVVRDMEKMYEELQKKKAVSLRDLWKLQVSRMEMESNLDLLQNSLLELAIQRNSLLAQKNAFIQEWRNNISEELVKLKRELDSDMKTLDKNRRLASYVDHKAPCDAMVHEIAPLSVGSAAREGETVMTLIPLDGKLEVEAEVRPQDISRVRNNAEVKIKLDAYPFQKYGAMYGVVRGISYCSVGSSGCRVRVGITCGLKRIPEGFRLLPGMTAEVEIKAVDRPAEE